MTREQLLKHWQVIEAYMNGAVIQYFNTSISEWLNVKDPSFEINKEYRIKKQSELIPFDFSDAEKLIAKAMKRKTTGVYCLITFVSDLGVEISGYFIPFYELLKQFTFLDGTPCGKIKE